MRQGTIDGVKAQKQLQILCMMASYFLKNHTTKVVTVVILQSFNGKHKTELCKRFSRNATLGTILGVKYRCIHYKQYTSCKTTWCISCTKPGRILQGQRRSWQCKKAYTVQMDFSAKSTCCTLCETCHVRQWWHF